MRISELKQFLSAQETILIQLPDGTAVPNHFHVTEVGEVTKHFVDCGGKVRHEKRASLQLWTAIPGRNDDPEIWSRGRRQRPDVARDPYRLPRPRGLWPATGSKKSSGVSGRLYRRRERWLHARWRLLLVGARWSIGVLFSVRYAYRTKDLRTKRPKNHPANSLTI